MREIDTLKKIVNADWKEQFVGSDLTIQNRCTFGRLFKHLTGVNGFKWLRSLMNTLSSANLAKTSINLKTIMIKVLSEATVEDYVERTELVKKAAGKFNVLAVKNKLDIITVKTLMQSITAPPAATTAQVELPAEASLPKIQIDSMPVAVDQTLAAAVLTAKVPANIIPGDKAQIEEAQTEKPQADKAQVEETQADKAKVDEAQTGEAKAENAQVDEAKVDEAQTSEAKVEDAKVEDTQADEAQTGKAKAENAQAKDAQVEIAQVEDAQVEEDLFGDALFAEVFADERQSSTPKLPVDLDLPSSGPNSPSASDSDNSRPRRHAKDKANLTLEKYAANNRRAHAKHSTPSSKH